MLFWIVPLARISLVSLEPDPQDLTKALEFQYEQKLQTLQTENAKLQNELAQLKKSFRSACPASYRKSQSPESSIEKVERDLPEKKTSPKTSTRELKVYREAMRDIDSENWNEAIVSMETFVKTFPDSELADHALYWIAEIYLQKGEVDLARAELERLIQVYPKGRRARRARAKIKELRTPLLKANEIQSENSRFQKNNSVQVSEPSIVSGGQP